MSAVKTISVAAARKRVQFLGEPDLTLVELPAGCKVVDRRQSAPPETN